MSVMMDRNLDAATARKFSNIIRAVLNERFGDVDIYSISIRPETDDEGDRILWIDVVIEGKRRRLDAAKASTLVRHIRPKLSAEGEDGIPVLSFIAKSELGKRRAETA